MGAGAGVVRQALEQWRRIDVLVERHDVDRVAVELGMAVGHRPVVLDLGGLP